MHGNLDIVMNIIAASNPDLLLCCGDWGDPDEIDEPMLLKIISAVHVLSVFGNHDDIELLSGIRNSDGSGILLSPGDIRKYGEIRIAGISGIWAKSHRKPYYVLDEEVIGYASGLEGKGIDILLTHGCASGMSDMVPGGRHGGQRAFLNAFNIIHPRLYLCGHLHKSQQRILKDGRIIINIGHTSAGDYWTFDIGHEYINYSRFLQSPEPGE